MTSGVMRALIFAWILGVALSADSPKKCPGQEVSTKTVYVTLDGDKPEAPNKPTTVPVVTKQNTKSVSRGATRKPSSRKTTAAASTTITETPTGAEFITLDPTQTKPGYITTTKEGSSDQTVVPVIIPFKGPPLVCFGCIKSFPPSIKIDTPKFCVELLGHKIGNCSSENKDDDKNSDNHDEDKDKNKDKDKDKDEDKDEEKDENDDDDKPTSTEKQSSLTKTAISTATTTATTQPKVPHILCSPSTCGRGSCSNSQKRSLDNSTLDLFERGIPEQGEWRDPSDYPSREKFMIGETNAIANSKREYSEFVRLSEGPQQKTTSSHVRFEDNPASLSVAGLFGCTSIVVVSKRGAWASHIWERVFSDDKNVQEMSINRVHRGDGPDSLVHPFGIDDLRNKPEDGARGVMFGDNSNPGDYPGVHVFIVTPRPRVPQYIAVSPEEVYTDDETRDNPNANDNLPPLYPDNIQQIQSDLKRTLGANVPIQIISYTPRVMTQAQAKELDSPDLTEGRRREVLGEAALRMFDPENESPRGKALIQYRPAKDCDEKARWRIWVEDRDVQAEATWNPENDQLFVEYEDGEMNEKRMKESPEEKKGSEGKKGPKVCPVKPGDGNGGSASKSTSKPTATRKGYATIAATPLNPLPNCKKDADCDGPDPRCNSGKKGVCNKHKKCRCLKIPMTTKPAPKTTTKELKTKTKAANPTTKVAKTKTKAPKPTTKDIKTTITLPKPTTTAPNPKPDSPKNPLERGPQRCNDEDDFPDHTDIHGKDVHVAAMNVCNGDKELLGPGDKFEKGEVGFYKNSYLKFRVTWIEGCTTEEGNQVMNVPDPLNRRNRASLCVELFYENYKKCYNGGVGGSRDVGCLRYYLGYSTN